MSKVLNNDPSQSLLQHERVTNSVLSPTRRLHVNFNVDHDVNARLVAKICVHHLHDELLRELHVVARRRVMRNTFRFHELVKPEVFVKTRLVGGDAFGQRAVCNKAEPFTLMRPVETEMRLWT
jgi:hypothetical protein